jgi:hypothetical protein
VNAAIELTSKVKTTVKNVMMQEFLSNPQKRVLAAIEK